MSLPRASALAFIVAVTLTPLGLARAEDSVPTGDPATAGEPPPEWLPSARNVKIELAPGSTASVPGNPTEELAPASSAPDQNTRELPLADDTAQITPEDKIEFVPESDAAPEVGAESPPVWLTSPPDQTAPAAVLETNSLWVRIRNGFAMRNLDSSLVTKHEQWYASRPDYVKRMTDRARRYLHYIVDEVEKRGMPTEIALLPMIESAFNPGALSTTRASGIWQFMPATGKNFGLKQNWWHDDRRDVISATDGALNYLQKLHDMFGDWELALAAYNWGEGAVQRAQAHNQRKGLRIDYASLRMPAETRNYVPKLLAIKNIIADPERFGLTLTDIPDQPYFAAVATTKHMDVKLAAQLADISTEEFLALNPEHNRPVILQNEGDVILLPVEKTETFRANLESYDKPLVSWQPYQPKRGERLDQLAPRFGLSVANLKAVNGLSARSNISTGQTLLVPLNGAESDGEFEAFNMQLAPIDTRISPLRHTVRKGDTYASLAQRYQISVVRLKRLNHSATLRVGRTITITPAATSRKHLGHHYVSGKRSVRYASIKNRGHSRTVLSVQKNRTGKIRVAVRKRRITKG